MKSLLRATIAAIGLLIASQANAATCFWVGGTASWSTANTASWASSTGGTASTCAATGGYPHSAADIATFDASSGGGTVTLDSSLSSLSIAQIIISAFTGTLTNAANNVPITLSTSFLDNGTGTHAFNCGTATIALTAKSGGVWNIGGNTNATYTCGSGTVVVQPSGTLVGIIVITPSRHTIGDIGTLTITSPAVNQPYIYEFNLQAATTFGTFNATNSPAMTFAGGITLTITNALNWSGTSTALLTVNVYPYNTVVTFTVGASTLSYLGLQNTTWSTAQTANNSYNQSGNTNIAINAPSAGGGGHIIGG
jgi:hypothetical protein